MSDEKQTEAQRFLAFSLNGEQYALPLFRVKEVIGLLKMTPTPCAPPHFKGLINLRGNIIPIIDLKLKLELGEAAFGPETSIIVLDLKPNVLGIVVDSIESVLALDAENLYPPPQVWDDKSKHLTGLGKKNEKLILLLDIDSVLGADSTHLDLSEQRAA